MIGSERDFCVVDIFIGFWAVGCFLELGGLVILWFIFFNSSKRLTAIRRRSNPARLIPFST